MTKAPFPTLLVANRGEIAKRIFSACATLGVRSVAVASEPDIDAAWHEGADIVVPLRGATASETYLDVPQILGAAESTGAAAIHPGYGFLSENASFAAACAAAGVVFVGPPVDAIRVMGSKSAALEIARRAGVPTIPGVRGDGRTDDDLLAEAAAIGFPLLIKASAGGGGRGMRLVREPAELADALQGARAEARSAFGDDAVLLERFFENARHVEVQVLGDDHGNLLHLNERECSIQRRYQKIIEEAPSPAVGQELRARMTASALSLAGAVDYRSAGTVEFLLDEDGAFYFLEMNTRLQVEHPVTELVTGVDLAAWQIRIAAGDELDFTAADLSPRGHAIECRVYAEDPANDYMPATGTLALYRPPRGPGIRCDDGVATGGSITPHYDPLIAKIITHGENREHARRRMQVALAETIVLGLTTNIGLLQRIVASAEFAAGATHTRFLDVHTDLAAPTLADAETWLAAATMEALGPLSAGDGIGLPTGALQSSTALEGSASADPFARLGEWRIKR